MAAITDYLNSKTLRLMEQTFSTVLAGPLRLLAPDGTPVSEGDLLLGQTGALQAPIRIHGDTIGFLHLAGTGNLTAKAASNFLRLLAAMLSTMCARQRELRHRIDDLTTLYRLTAEFTGQHDVDEVLTRVTSTVVQLLGVKACTIRLLDETGTKLQVKASDNFDNENLITQPINLADSTIDQEAIRTKKILFIPDLEKDSRALFPEGAQAEGLTSALCAPLVYKEQALGVLRVYSDHKEPFDRFDQALVLAVAMQAAAAIVAARLYEEAIAAATMKRQIKLAAEVQRRMLPHHQPELKGFEIASLYAPCFELGGDFYDFITLDHSNMGLTVGDVVGKGIRASLMTASVRASLRAHAMHVYDITRIIGSLNQTLCEETDVGDFATLFYGVLSTSGRRLTYVSAGHPPVLLIRDGQSAQLPGRGGALGVEPDWTWEQYAIDLFPHDVLLIFSDGFPEAVNFEDEAFGADRIATAANEAITMGLDADGIGKHVLWRLRNFAGLNTRLDDLTMVTVRVS